MNKQEMEFVTQLVTTTLGVQQTEIASVLFDMKEDDTAEVKPEALKFLLDKSAVRVASFKEAETKAHDKGFSKAKAEAISKFETELKEKLGVASDKQGLELIEFAISEKIKASGGEIDEEKIKRSPVYLKTLERLEKDKADAVKAAEDKFNELNNKIQKESTFKTIAEQANAVLDELKPILPTGQTAEGKSKAEIQRQRFLNELSSEYGFEIQDGKILVTKDGKILEDAHGNMIPLKDIVKNRASELWDFQQGEQRAGTGNNNNAAGANNGGGVKKYNGPAPKTAEEYSSMIGKAETIEERKEIMQLWEEGQKK